MGKEQGPHEFMLDADKIFYSKVGYNLSDYGMLSQAIILHHDELSDKRKRKTPQITAILSDGISELCRESGIPEEAVPILKPQFNNAVRKREEDVRRLDFNMQRKTVVKQT